MKRGVIGLVRKSENGDIGLQLPADWKCAPTIPQTGEVIYVGGRKGVTLPKHWGTMRGPGFSVFAMV